VPQLLMGPECAAAVDGARQRCRFCRRGLASLLCFRRGRPTALLQQQELNRTIVEKDSVINI
jgi:hypothetical protein